jgi:hypothetical protein
MGTVRVRPTTGPDRVFDIDERIYRAFPDDYQVAGEPDPSGYRPPRTAASAAPTTPVIGGTAEEGAN